MVTRYDCYCDGDECDPLESEYGAYVKYDDYSNSVYVLEEAIAVLTKKLEDISYIAG
jgi:hypothetical protein